MKTSHELVGYARMMLSIFAGLAVFSLVAMLRSFYRPVDPTPETVARLRKLLLLNSWVMFAAVGGAIQAFVSKEYYLLGASALLFSFVLPVIVHYVRLKTAFRARSTPKDSGSFDPAQ
jgi:membrane associated rhomboid family serine protease